LDKIQGQLKRDEVFSKSVLSVEREIKGQKKKPQT
jgi:hypothetical protein